MAGPGELLGSIGLNSGGSLISILFTIILGVGGLIVVIALMWWFVFKRKKYNIKVEFRIPRSIQEKKTDDGLTVDGSINKEWGKGYYNSKRGEVWIKRKGMKDIPMKPFDIKKYLSSNNILTVVQMGVADYRPIHEDSYLLMKGTDKEEYALLSVRVDSTKDIAWRNNLERNLKNTYAIKNWLAQNAQLIGMGLVIFMVLIGQAIVIQKLG